MGTSESKEQMYWIGPYSIKIHVSIQAVVDADGYNILFANGTHTNRATPIIPLNMNSFIYKETYAELRDDDQYYYKGINKNFDDFWVGPYDVRIHVFFPYVVGADGYNTHYKDGSTTKLSLLKPDLMNENIYKFEHCKLMNDGYYYYYK